MNNKAMGMTSLMLAILGLLATVCLFAMEPMLHKYLNTEAAALGVGAISLLACVLGWLSFKTGSGKTAAIIGTLLVLFFFVELFWTSDGPARPAPPPAPASAPEMRHRSMND